LEKKYGEPVLEEYEWLQYEEESDRKVDYDDLDDKETVDSSTEQDL
jgi:hypothetical protein